MLPVVCALCSSATGTVSISLGNVLTATPPTFLAHGWESFTARGAFQHFEDPVFKTAASHLSGQAVRVGGISADFLHYVMDDDVTPSCPWSKYQPFAPDPPYGICPFSTGAFDKLADFLRGAGLVLLFDLNELAGRNCTRPGVKPWQPAQWCGDPPAAWDTGPLRGLLEHIRSRDLEGFIGFEVGNELFRPPHISHATASADVATLAALLKQVWGTVDPPRFYSSGTNDCDVNDNVDIMSALEAVKSPRGLSFHSYPADRSGWWDKNDLASYLLNTTWLRHETLAQVAPCLVAWNNGPRGESKKQTTPAPS